MLIVLHGVMQGFFAVVTIPDEKSLSTVYGQPLNAIEQNLLIGTLMSADVFDAHRKKCLTKLHR